MIRKVKFTSIPVTDQDRALRFYVDRLGFSIMTDQPFDENQRWIELSIDGAETRVVLFTPDEHRDRIGTFSNIAFQSDDVEATHRRMVEKGVEFLQPPQTQEWGTSAVFRDPDGNRFVLSSRD